MSHNITDETIEQAGILAKLELSEADREHAKKDMEEMLTYIDKLNELDTNGIEPMSHIFSMRNVFREDLPDGEMTEVDTADEERTSDFHDGGEAALANAPYREGRTFVVPRTVAEQPGGVA